jgi:hypothetical protein
MVLWLIARPKVIGVVLALALLAYGAYRAYDAGVARERLRQQMEVGRAVDGALKGAAEANRQLDARPVDDLLKDKGWVRQ